AGAATSPARRHLLMGGKYDIYPHERLSGPLSSRTDVSLHPVRARPRESRSPHAGRLAPQIGVGGKMRRRFLRAISVTTVGLSVVLGAGCQSSSSGPPKVSGLEKTN